MSRLQVVFLAVIVACVRQSSAALVDTLYYTVAQDSTPCKDISVADLVSGAKHCAGGFEKAMTSSSTDNVIPQQDSGTNGVLYTLMRYEGSGAAPTYLALVDTGISPSTPCAKEEAGHAQDVYHSGAMQPFADGVGPAAGTVVKLDQSDNGKLLDSTKEYAVCATTGDGSLTDTSWADMSIRVRVSRLSRIDIYDRKFQSCSNADPCVIPNHPALTIRYYGSIDPNRHISFVDSTLNSNAPCNDGQVAAGWKDFQHSGSIEAAGNIFIVDTASLDKDKTFTVCYSENGGLFGSVWIDSGLRVKRSAITSIETGVGTDVGQGVVYSAWNRNHDDNNLVPADRLMMHSSVAVSFTGGFDSGTHRIAVVNAALVAGQPCLYPQLATAQATQPTLVTPVVLAVGNQVTLDTSGLTQLDGSDDLHVFAVCYATGAGDSADTTWADSYVRYSLTALRSITHHNAVHQTWGTVPYSTDTNFRISSAVPLNNLMFIKEQKSAHHRDASITSSGTGLAHTSFRTYDPCFTGPGGNGADEQSTSIGPDSNSLDVAILDTSGLDTGTIVDGSFANGDSVIAGNTRVEHSFAVCYQITGVASNWYDSGIRVAVSKMSQISHGKQVTPHTPYVFVPGSASSSLPVTGQAAARQVIPNSPNQDVTYTATPTAGTALGNDRFFSIVDASLNANKPCLLGTIAAAGADTTHSGSLSANSGTTTVTIPQADNTEYLDDTKTYAVCYAVTSGTIADPTWIDSYIRLTVSSVEAIESLGVTHKVNDYIATIASREATSTYNAFYYKDSSPSLLPLVYSGTLADGKYLSLADVTLNANFPCASDVVATGSSGVNGLNPQSGGSNSADTAKTVLFQTDGLDYNRTYAICYSSTGSSSGYHDSGIRVKRSIVTAVRYHSGYDKPLPREMTSVEYATNVLPILPSSDTANIELSYMGAVTPDGTNLFISFVDASANSNDPCVNPGIAGLSSVSGGTGGLAVAAANGAGDKLIATLPATVDFTVSKVAVCYATVDGGTSDVTYRDSYIRLAMTKLSILSHVVGRVNSVHGGGRTLVHLTDGHLPSVSPDIWTLSDHQFTQIQTTFPPNAATTRVSLVSTTVSGAEHIRNGATYHEPCTPAGVGVNPSATSTGPTGITVGVPVTSASVATFPVTLSTLSLDTSVIYALCYSTDTGTSYSDSGMRFTISKIKSFTFHTLDSPPRVMDPKFLSTNRIPQWHNVQLEYQGSSDLFGKYVALVEDSTSGVATTGPGSDGSGNPCSVWATPASAASGSVSGVIQLRGLRACTQTDEYKISAGTPLDITGSVSAAITSGVTVTTWAACRDACEATPACSSVRFEKTSGICSTYSTTVNAEDSYGSEVDNKGVWISATCSSGSDSNTATVPQFDGGGNQFLAAGTGFDKTYALCYSEFESDTSTASSGGSTSIWLDSYVRLKPTPLANLETSGTVHWSTGQIPVYGTQVSYDYFGSNDDHFVYHGEDHATTDIRFVEHTDNNNVPCYATSFSQSPDSSVSPTSSSRANTQHKLVDTTSLDAGITFAVCLKQGANYGDSGIRVTVSKLAGVELASGHSGLAAHDAVTPRVMTTKPALTNRFPRQANQALKMVPTSTNGVSSTDFISLVRTTLNNGKPCIGSDAYAAASTEHSGPVQASSFSATIPQSTLLGSSDNHMKFRVCYGTSNDASGNWQDSYITLEMSDITSLNVHFSSSTGLRSLVSDSAEHSVSIKTVGQVPAQRASQTGRYTVTGNPSSIQYKISLVESNENQVVDSVNQGSVSTPIANTGYSRPDPCHALNHADTTGFASYSAWLAAGSNADPTKVVHGSLNSNMDMLDLDTSTLDSEKMYAVCYGTGTPYVSYDSGIRVTVPQVVALQYADSFRSDRVREMTSVTKSYNVLPLGTDSPPVGAKYVLGYSASANAFNDKLIKLIPQSANNYNPCVQDLTDPSIAQTTSTGVGTKDINFPAFTLDTVYAVCYATLASASEITTNGQRQWIRDRTGSLDASTVLTKQTLRDTYIRVLASGISSVTSNLIQYNLRGQIAGHPSLKVAYEGPAALGADVKMALVDESLNTLTLNGATYSFPCSREFGANANGPDAAPSTSCVSSTHDCDKTGPKTAANAVVTFDTTDLGVNRVFAVCYAPAAGDGSSWRDSGIRLTVPEVQAMSMSSGQAGTPPRMYKSWDTVAIGVASTTVLDRPTSRLPAKDGMILTYYPHPSSTGARVGTAAATLFALKKIAPGNGYNPCAESQADVATRTPCTNDQCEDTGSIDTTGTLDVTIPQESTKLLSRSPSGDASSATFAVCYQSAGSNDQTITELMHDESAQSHSQTDSFTNNTVFWEDTFIRLKISSLASMTASGVTHVTTGQIPSTVKEDVTDWGSIIAHSDHTFVFDSAVGDSIAAIALVDASIAPQANGEGLPCDNSGSTDHIGTAGSGTSITTTTKFDTSVLNSTKVYALCYNDQTTSSSTAWRDSGIRLTVTELTAVRILSGYNGPSNKEDVRSRVMTSYGLPTNTFPRKTTQELTYDGTLAENQYISLVQVSASATSNPCLMPNSQASPAGVNNAVERTPPSLASGKVADLSQSASKMLAEDAIFAVCYDGGVSAPIFQHSPECNCGEETNAGLRQNCMSSCTTAIGTNRGQAASITWRDSYIRLRASTVQALKITFGADTTTSNLKTVTIRTNGQIPATVVNPSQVIIGYEAFEWTSRQLRFIDAEGTDAAAPDNAGVTHKDPCSVAGTAAVNAAGSKAGIPADSRHNILDMDTAALDTTKTFAVCYSNTNPTPTSWHDSGIRITVTKMQSLHYLGYTSGGMSYDDAQFGYTAMVAAEHPLMTLRDRPWTSVKTSLHRLPQAPNIQLRYDSGAAGVWLVGGVAEPTGNLGDNKHVSIVADHLNSNNPCVNSVIAATGPTAAGTTNKRLHSGVMTATGTWVTVPQGAGNLLDPTKEYAVCYATGDGSATDITWRDSFIRLEISEIAAIQQAVTKEDHTKDWTSQFIYTTGNLADSNALNIRLSAQTSAFKINLVDSSNSPIVTSESNGVSVSTTAQNFPCSRNVGRCTVVHTPTATSDCDTTNTGVFTGQCAALTLCIPGTANNGGCGTAGSCTSILEISDSRSTGPTVAGMDHSVNTRTLHRDNSGEIVYALCYQEGSNAWEDSALRLTLTQVNEILYRSGYDRGEAWNTLTLGAGGIWNGASVASGGDHVVTDDYFQNQWGLDTKEDTKARHMSSKYSVKNRMPMTADSAYSQFEYVTVPNSNMAGGTGNNAKISLVSVVEGTSWSSPCDLDAITTSTPTSSRSGQYSTVSASSKIVDFVNSTTRDHATEFAVCYSQDGAAGSWRDSWIRFKWSWIQHISTLGVNIRTYGQLPNTAASEELEVEYTGELTASQWIALVDETLADNRPCDSGNGNMVSNISPQKGGTHQAEYNTKKITSLDTTTLYTDRAFAVCYGSSSSDASAWYDSGIRVTISAIHTATLPFENPVTAWDACRGLGHTCTTSDRPMTSYPRATNRLALFDKQTLVLSGDASTNTYISIVDTSLNSGNPCVDPSIPGGAVGSNYAANVALGNDAKQKTETAQATGQTVVIRQDTNNKLYGATMAVSDVSNSYGTLGREYTICYATGTGSATDETWRDSYIRLKVSDILSFGTKYVPHFTAGVIPHHALTVGGEEDGKGLEYFYGFDSANSLGVLHATTRITLVEDVSHWEDPAMSVDATVSNGQGLNKITFTGQSDNTPTAVTVKVGYLIMLENEERTIVGVDTCTTNDCEVAYVSQPFTQAHTNVQVYFKTHGGNNLATSHAKKPYDPCTVQNSPSHTIAFNQASDAEHVKSATPRTTTAIAGRGDVSYHKVDEFDSDKLKSGTSYAVCYSPNVGDTTTAATTDDWFDTGIRVERSKLSHIEYSGHKRGVIGFPTAYNLLDGGYRDLGAGDCTGTTVTHAYYFNARMTDAECRAKCDGYVDCLGYQASTTSVPEYGARTMHCKIWKAADSSSTITSVGAAWGNSHCMIKTAGSDEITTGKSHRKIGATVLELQDRSNCAGNLCPTGSRISATVLPMNTSLDLVYAGTLAASSYIALVKLNDDGIDKPSPSSGLYNPCADAYNPATASNSSSGPQRACYSPGPGYTVDLPGGQYPRPGGLCKPSGTVCHDTHAKYMATLHAVGCPNKDKRFVSNSLLNTWDGAANDGARWASLRSTCDNVATDTESQSACCGQDSNGIPLACPASLTCATPTQWSDCSSDVSQEANKEVSFAMGTMLDQNSAFSGTTWDGGDGTYTVCYTDGDGSVSDSNWRDSYVRVTLSEVTAIVASGVTHTDHGTLASHDSHSKLEVEYTGDSAGDGYRLSFVQEQLNMNNPCSVSSFADGSNGGGTVVPVGPACEGARNCNHAISNTASSKRVEIQTNHLDTTLTYAVCYEPTSNVWRDSGIRVRISELTNIRYNEDQNGDSSIAGGQYTRDMTSSRVRVAPSHATDPFTDKAAGYAVANAYEDIRDHTATHTLPLSTADYDLHYLGELEHSSKISLVDIQENFGDPCVLKAITESASGVSHAGFTHVQAQTADASKIWAFPFADLQALDSTKTYTVCYKPASATNEQDPFSQNAVPHMEFHGIEPPVKGWRDSYIRFTVSKISTVSSHDLDHQTQGLIANAGPGEYALKFQGVGLTGVSSVSFVSETTNSGYPCTGNPAASGHPATPANANNNLFEAEVDSSGMDTDNNFALCYQDTSGWHDTGIRVWVSKVTKVAYNMEQATEVARDVYLREYYPFNTIANGATDSDPAATNRFPLNVPAFKMRYHGASVGTALAGAGVTKFSFIQSDVNSRDGGCARAEHAEASDGVSNLNTGFAVANPVGVSNGGAIGEFVVDTITGASYPSFRRLTGTTMIALCYYDTTAPWSTTGGGQWRDSHIRWEPTKLSILETYGIKHRTMGMISAKANLRVMSGGIGAHQGFLVDDTLYKLSLVEQSRNDKQPCHRSEAGQSMSRGTHSGVSTVNAYSPAPSIHQHELNTAGLDPSFTYALCYTVGSGSTSDTLWKDSGLRLSTPMVTQINYNQPSRTITSSSCHAADNNLYGPADCNPSRTCNGHSCTPNEESATCAHDSTLTCAVIPRGSGDSGNGIDYTLGNEGSFAVSGVTFVSFVDQTLGVEANDPCRDANQASADANSAGGTNTRLHSGKLAVTNNGFNLPQLEDVGTTTFNLLDPDKTYAVCYSTGDGSASDGTWRDSYVRVILSKISYVKGSDMVVKTKGTFANVPSLRVEWHGSLGHNKWINLVAVQANSNKPCNKAFAEGAAQAWQQCGEGCMFDISSEISVDATIATMAACKTECMTTANCVSYTFLDVNYATAGDRGCHLFTKAQSYTGSETRNVPGATSASLDTASTLGGAVSTFDAEGAGWLRADPSEEFVDYDTTSLTANTLYTVCYADSPNTLTNAVWTDSAIRLRFMKWTNPQKSRIASGAATLMKFQINTGSLLASARIALLKDQSTCASASGAPLLSDGSLAKRQLSQVSGAYQFAMPSGTHASYRGAAWHECYPVVLPNPANPTDSSRLDMTTTEPCEDPGKLNDINLQEGSYIMCYCDGDHGDGNCDTTNEWIKLSSSGVSGAMLRVVQTPRLGRAATNFDATSHIGSVRGLSMKSHTYNIKTTNTSGLEVADGDKIFFTASSSCDAIPTADAANQTAPISVTAYDTDTTSNTYKSGRVVTPSVTPLQSDGFSPRNLVSCFATQESVMGTAEARDYATLQDGLEIVPKPRLGSNVHGGKQGAIRALSGSSPTFEAQSFRAGDKLFFKQMTQTPWQLTGFLDTGAANWNNLCDYSLGESCSCDASGTLSCSNGAKSCHGFSCTNTIPSGADVDCTDGEIDAFGVITHDLLQASNTVDGTSLLTGTQFWDSGPSGMTTTHVVTITNAGKYAIDGNSQADLVGSVGNTYIFTMNSQDNNLPDHPLLFSASQGGEHVDADVYTTGMTFELNGQAVDLAAYKTYFKTATTRKITYVASSAVTLHYYSSSHEDTAQTYDRSTPDQDQYTMQRTEMGSFFEVHRDDAGTFRLPTDTPLTAQSATTPRFLSACFIPAGAVIEQHAPSAPGGSNCSYSSPHDSTCTKSLVNSHRLEDYLQVLPEPTDNLQTSHNASEVYNLRFNEPQFGTFWKASNHWCPNEPDTFLHPCGVRSTDRSKPGDSYLCCEEQPNFASGSPDDVIVLKKEETAGSGDCVGVHEITDSDYFIGAQHSRKMMLTTIDDDRTTQTSPIRSDLSQNQLRQAAEKGAEASHYAIASGKVNELPPGFYTICYATAESGADDNEDFVQLSKSIEILDKSNVAPSFTIPRTVLLGHSINVKWAATSGFQNKPSESHSWVGLFRRVDGVGECANGVGESQNKCFLAAQTVEDGITGEGTISFSSSDYKLTAGEYEVRYFDGSSRDGHGMICRGIPNVARDTYINCIYESTVTSSPIIVYSNINDMDENAGIPGLEMVFNGEAARYAGNGEGLPGRENVNKN